MFGKKEKTAKEPETKPTLSELAPNKPKKTANTKLTNAEKKQIRDVIAKHKSNGKKEKSAQESVPYLKV